MIELRVTPDGVLLPVHAQPGARRERIVGEHGGRLKVAVSQPAEKGRANAAIIEFLASELGIRSSQLTIRSGEASPRKLLQISGVTTEQVRAWLERVGSQ
jgi:uncharacterized protein (TIGR00251 family)